MICSINFDIIISTLKTILKGYLLHINAYTFLTIVIYTAYRVPKMKEI